MKGAFVSNGFMRSKKLSQPADMVCAAAERMGIGMLRTTNDRLAAPIGGRREAEKALGDVDFIIFWDKDVRLAGNLELCGYPVFNSSECIRICDDKSLTHMALASAGARSIPTVSLPLSFGPYTDFGFVEGLERSLGYPMVVKDCFGSFGEQVRLVRDRDSLMALLSGPYVPRIAQKYIETGATDIRAEVIGGRVAEAVVRHGPEGDFRSNCTIGGRMEPCKLSDECAELAVKAAEAVGADFCGVDILMTDGAPAVCEVNSNAHIRNLADCTGHDVSEDILRHIVSCLRRWHADMDPLRPLRLREERLLRREAL